MERKERKPTTGGVLLGSSYDEARTRKINAEAEIAELELAKIRQTLCLTEDVVKAWESVLHACKSKFLSMPSKISPILANESDAAVVKQLLEDQIREALSELANYQPAIDPVNTGATAIESVGSDEEQKPKRKVGRPKKVRSI